MLEVGWGENAWIVWNLQMEHSKSLQLANKDLLNSKSILIIYISTDTEKILYLISLYSVSFDFEV